MIGPVFLLIAILAVLLWAAGVVPFAAVFKTLAALVVALIAYVVSAAIGARRRRRRFLDPYQPPPPVALMGVAGENITKGTLVSVDATGRVVTVQTGWSREPTAEELKETGKPQ